MPRQLTTLILLYSRKKREEKKINQTTAMELNAKQCLVISIECGQFHPACRLSTRLSIISNPHNTKIIYYYSIRLLNSISQTPKTTLKQLL